MKPWHSYIEITARPDALVRDAANDDLAWLEAKGSKSLDEFAHVYRLLIEAFGDRRVSAVRREEVAAWFRWRGAQLRPDGQPVVAANTAHKIRSMWAAFFERAGAEPNPAHLPPGTLPPRAPRPDYRPAEDVLTPHEASRLISTVSIALRWRVLYALAIFTGARLGECSAFRFRHLVARHPMWGLRVVDSYSTKRKAIGTTKGALDLIVPIAPPLEELLDEWRHGGFAKVDGCTGPGMMFRPDGVALPEAAWDQIIGALGGWKRWAEFRVQILP